MPVAKNLDEVASGIHQNLKLLIEKDGVMTGRFLVFHISLPLSLIRISYIQSLA